MARYAGHLSRRLFLRGTLAQASLGLLAACGLLPSRASPAKRPRVGLLMIDNLGQFPGAFQLGLGELGYAPGAVNIDFRWAESADRLSELAAELVALNVDVIIVPNSQAALAAKQATDAVPIVFAGAGDPVGTGLVTSLAHPGGTITGLTRLSSQLSTKRLELLKEVVPEASRVAVLLNPSNPDNGLDLRETELAARTLGIQIQSLEVRNPSDLNGAFTAATNGGTQGLITFPDTLTEVYRAPIISLVARAGLAAVYDTRLFVDAGGLMAYGASLPDLYRRTAAYVDKILKGGQAG